MRLVRPAIQFIKDTLGNNLIGAEIGVWLGKHSAEICHYLNIKKLYSVDNWEKDYLVKRPKRRWISGARGYRAAKRRLSAYPEVEIIKKASEEAVVLIPDGSLDFVYIDAKHTELAVTIDISIWTPKVKKGGIVSGHDFGYKMSPGVVPAVFKYVYKHGLRGYFENKDWWFINGKQ